MRLLTFFVFILLQANGSLVLAQQERPTIIASTKQSAVLDISDRVEIAVDSNIRDQDNFTYMPLDSFSGNYAQGITYWLRFTIDSALLSPSRMLVVKTDLEGYEYYSRWDKLTLLQLDAEGNIIDQQENGVMTPRSKKRLKREAGLVAGLLKPNGADTSMVILRLSNLYGTAQKQLVRIELRDPAVPVPASGLHNLLLILSSITFVLSFLALFFFLFMRSKSYLYFYLYLVFLGAHYLILHPAVPFTNWLIPEHPQLTPYFFMVLAFGSFILFMVFGRHFMNLRALSQRTDRWLQVAIASWILIIAAELLCLAVFQRNVLDPWITLLIPLTALGFLIRIAFFKNTLARIFVIGAAWLLFFSLLGMLFAEPLEAIGINPWPIGQVGQILIYMAGLAYQVRENERKRAEAQRISEMDSIKSKFFANISHEFRTPLTLIRGVLQQIQLAKKPGNDDAVPMASKQLGTLQRNADRLLELVNQLLDLSRLDSGTMKLHMAKGDVLQVVRSIVHSFDTMAERKQIMYQVNFPEHDPVAFFDRDKLEKIISNLLSNAFKYTPDGGRIAVEVSIGEGRMRITVSDSGPGISRHELNKIFDRFYQVEGNEDKGSGIGLALVKELVTLYRGQISVNSEPGKGSQFKISLPIEPTQFDEQHVVPETSAGGASDESLSVQDNTVSRSNGRRESKPRLLVVEDNEDLRQFICESLQDRFEISEAVHGQEGLQKARLEIPDLIISDVMMPRMDGFAMCGKLKRDERTSHIPVILLTAKAGQSHKIEGLETGADDYLTKPFDVQELRVRTQNLIEQRQLLKQKFAGTIQLKPAEIVADSLDVQFLQRTMQAIEANMQDENFGVEELAKAVAMSRSQLHRKLVALVDKTPSDVIRQTRLLRAKELLEQHAGTPAEVAYKVGFNSHSYFTKCYKEEFGYNPSEAR